MSPEAGKRSPLHTKDEPGSIRAWTPAFIDRRCSYLSYVLLPLLHGGGQAPCRFSPLRGAIFHKRLHLLKMCVAAFHHGCSQVGHGNRLHGNGLLVMCHLDMAPGLKRNLASSTLCLGNCRVGQSSRQVRHSAGVESQHQAVGQLNG